jgi:hypothetical protein
MARILRTALAGVAIGVLITAGVSWAAHNTHTVGNWSHGLGDGADNDDYVHAYNHQVNEQPKDGLKISVAYSWTDQYSEIVDRKRCSDCYHLHKSVDTASLRRPDGQIGVRECKFFSGHTMPSIDWHFHFHHDYCS